MSPCPQAHPGAPTFNVPIPIPNHQLAQVSISFLSVTNLTSSRKGAFPSLTEATSCLMTTDAPLVTGEEKLIPVSDVLNFAKSFLRGNIEVVFKAAGFSLKQLKY